MESILTSIKKLLGIAEEDTHFDTDVIMHINAAFSTLTQIGVGPSVGFSIQDSSKTWSNFTSRKDIESLKQYVYLKVKIVFDSTSMSAAAINSATEIIKELEWRLNAAVDNEPIVDPDTPSAGGTTDYTKLENLPSINGEVLIGNYDEKDPSVTEMTEEDIDSMWNEHFNE